MIDIFTLHSSLTESAVYGTSQVPAMTLVGDLSESTFGDANHAIMSEAYSISEYVTRSDEIIAEAAINNADRVDILVENVFSGIFAKMKALWEKFIATVKAILNKIKAFFLRITGQTKNWSKSMKPRLEEAKRKRGADEFQAELHEWDNELLDYLCDLDVDANMADVYAGSKGAKIDVTDVPKAIDAFVTAIEQLSAAKDDPDADSAAAKYKDFDISDDEKDEYKEQIIAAMASKAKLGTMSADTADEFKSALIKKVYGDKVTQTISMKRSDDMLKAVEGGSDRIKKIEKSYNDVLQKLNTQKSKIESGQKKIENAKSEGNAAVYYKNYATKSIAFICDINSFINTVFNNTKNVTLSAVKAQISEYQTVLTKYANQKDKKD